MKRSVKAKTIPRLKTGNRSLAIKYLPIHKLHPNPHNARIHSEKQISQIARSIKTFGFLVPTLIDGNGNVIAGHGRLFACKELGITEVPAICVDHMTEAQRTAFMIADNRLTENSTFDEHLLGEQLKILSASDLDFSLEVTGFEMAEIDLYIEGLSAAEKDEANPADLISERGPAVSKPGDMWFLRKHRLLCGDALDPSNYSLLMGSKKANLVFTDPPFNIPINGNVAGFGKHHAREFAMASGEMSDAEFTEFLRKTLFNAASHSLSGSIHFVCMDWTHSAHLLSVGAEVYSEFKSLCVWAKDAGGQGSFYRSAHELIFVFKHGTTSHRNNIQLGRFGRYRTNVWNYPRVHSFGRPSSEGIPSGVHPTMKPVALVADAILDCSARGDLVLDPFLGSGTTIVAAERTGRVCFGLELDPKYVDVGVRRWQTFTGQSATHAETGETFRSHEEAASEKEK
jgi:DNA modification methylase